MVFLHGGGWQVGSRHSAGPAYAGRPPTPFERIAQAGIAVASVDYRLSGEATWPAQLHDAKAAVRWLRARADEIGIDPDRIAAWGESAGGHLAELLGLTIDDAGLEGDVGITGPSSAVSAVAAWYAPSDVAAVATDIGADPADPTTREARLLGRPGAERAGARRPGQPDQPRAAGAPPFLLLHGDADRFIPASRASGCTPPSSRPGSRPSSISTRTPTTCGWARPRPPPQALDRTADFLRTSWRLEEETTHEDRGHPPRRTGRSRSPRCRTTARR